MIDTTLLIDYFRKTDKSKAKLTQLSEQFDRLSISTITEFEIYGGATAAQLPFWDSLLSEITVIPFDTKAARIAVNIQRDLKKVRKSIEKADLFIAATAVANEIPLATLNRKHFVDIKQLTLLDNSNAS